MNAPYADLWNFAGKYRDQSNLDPLTSTSTQVQGLLDSGAVTRTQHQGTNESGEYNFFTDDVNWASPGVPAPGPANADPRYGNWMPVGARGMGNLINQGLVYNDPNYGAMTPGFNDKTNQRNWYDLIGPIFSAALTMGAGALAGGGMMAGTLLGTEGAAAAAAATTAAGTLSSVPWWINSGLSVAKAIGNMGGPDAPNNFPQSNHPYSVPPVSNFGPPVKTMPVEPPNSYTPDMFGNMGALGGGTNGAGSQPAVDDGSQMVATATAPGAYQNSYNSVTV